MPGREHGAEEAWLDLVSGRRTGLAATTERALLGAAAVGYGLGLRIREATYRYGLVRPVEVPARVISVGNLTLGGTGKTPAVIHLAERLRGEGERVAVLTRGHGGSRPQPVNVVHDGERRLLGIAEAGDEAVLLADRLGNVPVLCGKDRRLTARAAVERFAATVLVLDDAFQYRRLRIGEHIVVLDATQPFGTGRLFPAGILRDPPRDLRRASEVWLSRTDHPGVDLPSLLAEVERLAPGVPVRSTRHAPSRLTVFDTGEQLEPSALSGLRVAALSGIGNPAAFAQTLRAAGAAEVIEEPFADHHRYNEQDLRGVVERARDAACAVVVTTEKDAVRLREVWTGAPPLWVLGVDLVVDPASAEGASAGSENSRRI
jgi:tetraacyldisaccharide 4'-kinase